jgi:hypothetical protein
VPGQTDFSNRPSTDDVASSISFTAVLGVIVVLGLPLLIPLLSLSETQYGILAGMTVYAVPQVLAATIPAGLVSTQIGTLVNLIRVDTGPGSCLHRHSGAGSPRRTVVNRSGEQQFLQGCALVHRGLLFNGRVSLALIDSR